MKKFVSKTMSLLLVAVMALSLAACGSKTNDSSQAAPESTGSASGESTAATQPAGNSGEKIVNVGVTDTLGSLNPLLLNGGEINKYATALMFLPPYGTGCGPEFPGNAGRFHHYGG